jgi:hypothetical protein
LEQQPPLGRSAAERLRPGVLVTRRVFAVQPVGDELAFKLHVALHGIWVIEKSMDRCFSIVEQIGVGESLFAAHAERLNVEGLPGSERQLALGSKTNRLKHPVV